jgi:hypothetical protein
VRPGWVRVDCHLHTVRSGDAVTTVDRLAEMPDFDGPETFVAALGEARIHGEFGAHAAFP